MTPMINLVNNLNGLVGMPQEIRVKSNHIQLLWMMGKQKAIKDLRSTVKQSNSEELQFLQKVPKNLEKVYGNDSMHWLNAYNYTLDIFYAKVNVMIFQATNGQMGQSNFIL